VARGSGGMRAERMLDAAPEPSVVMVGGPWRHREISANGQRFHVAEHGDPDAPTLLLLHGFPEFWWSWRHQLVALGEAGWHAVAMDLRGYGASDKPPRGYDGPTLTADVAGVIRALGKGKAVVVGHDWGGLLGWWLAATAPHLVRAFVPVSCAHPLAHRTAVLRARSGQARASSYFWRFQMPRADDWLTDDDADEVSRVLHGWGGTGFPDDDTDRRYREAMQITGAAHCALEYYRWLIRSQARPSGVRWARQTARPITVPVLQLHGGADPCVLPTTARLSARFVSGDHTWHSYDGVGHFLPEEAPQRVSEDLRDWLGKP
jgi:pimeloyl-ACP methyl ester carboxylesterase